MLAFLLFTGCNPQHATITDGHWFTWLARNSSKVFIDESLPFLEDLSESSYDENCIFTYLCLNALVVHVETMVTFVNKTVLVILLVTIAVM